MGKNFTCINATTIKCIKMAVEEGKFSIKPMKFNNIIRIKIDKVELVRINDEFRLNCDEDIEKNYIIAWRDDIGGVLRNDMKRGDMSEYYELTTFGTKTLVRKLDPEVDSELVLKFKKNNIIECGDYVYLPIKTVSSECSYFVNDNEFNSEIILTDEEDVVKLPELDDSEDVFTKEDEELINYYTPLTE